MEASWWECKLVQPLWRTVWRTLKKLKTELLYDPAIPLLGVYSYLSFYSLGLCFQFGILFLYFLAFYFSSFLSCLLSLLRQPLCLFAFLFLWDGFSHWFLFNSMNFHAQFFRRCLPHLIP